MKWAFIISIALALIGAEICYGQQPPTNPVPHIYTNCYPSIPITNLFLVWTNQTSNCWAHLLKANQIERSNLDVPMSQWYEIGYTNLDTNGNYLVEQIINQSQAFYRVVLEPTNN